MSFTFTTNLNEIENGKTVLLYGEYAATGGPAIEAWDEDGPYADVSICVPNIICKDNQIILNHDILFDKKFVSAFKKYLCTEEEEVCYGPFNTRSSLVTLKDNWKDLCISMESL